MPRNIYGNSVTQSAMIDKLRNDIDTELANQIVSITNETIARENLENILSASIIQEQINRDSTISAEITNRVSAVATLTASINQETVNRTTDTDLLDGAISQERDTRISALFGVTGAVEELQNSNIGNYVKKNRTYITSIDSGSYIDLDLDGMNITPPVGTYKVDFSCWTENDEKKDDDGLEIALCVDDVIIEHSKRRQWTGEAGKYETSIHTQAVVTVSGTQQIKVKAYRLGGDSIRIRQRSIIAICIGSSI